MSDKAFISISLASVAILAVMMNLTTPSEIGPLGVLVFFTLSYAICLGVMVTLCRAILTVGLTIKRGDKSAIRKKSYYYGSVLAFVPIILIFMRSFGGLNILEIILVVLFVGVACFYISKRA
jgi:nitrogen fixation/metabolism regulation signal transduction histidine kinase